MTHFLRLIQFGYQNFIRNIWLSVVTILILSLNLFLATSIYGLSMLGQQTLIAVKEKITLSVYFKPTTTDDRATTISDDISRRADVQRVDVVTRAQHLADFKKTQSNNKLVTDALDQLGENPLGPGLVITAKHLDDYAAIVKALEDPSYATLIEETGRDYETNQTVITRLSKYLQRVSTVTIYLTGLFALVAFLMIFNTIRVAIYSQREEIGIMKLVGASDAYVRGPFVVTSVIYGVIAAVVSTLIFLPIISASRPFFDQFFAGYNVDVAGYVWSHFWNILGVEILAGSIVAVVSSFGAIGRYLRV